MAERVYRLTPHVLRQLHALFCLCPIPLYSGKDFDIMHKDALVDALLNFLKHPGPEQCVNGENKEQEKASAKQEQQSKNNDSSVGGAGKQQQRSTTTKPTSSSFQHLNSSTTSKQKQQPTHLQLRHWVIAYICCFSLNHVTLSHAVQTASDKFGVVLNQQSRDTIYQLLLEEG